MGNVTVAQIVLGWGTFFRMSNFAWQFYYRWNRGRAILPLTQMCEIRYSHCLIARQGLDLSVYTSLKCCFLLEIVREKYSYISDPILHFMPVAKNFPTICSWPQPKGIRCNICFNNNRGCIKLAQFGIPVNKTTYLFPSIGGSNISRGCGKNLEIPQGMGVNLGVWFRKI